MLDKFIETLYNKVFVNIVVEGNQTIVYLELCKGRAPYELIESEHATFETQKVNTKMLNFIDAYVKETPYYYICVLDNSLDQGAIPTCDKHRLSYYHDISASEYKCSEGKWTYYTSKTDLYAIEKNYQTVGVDFIFSPFTILWHFFKDKISTGMAMFVLVQADTLSIAIFENSELLYGDHIDMLRSVEADELSSGDLDDEIDLDFGEGIDLEGIDVDSDDVSLIDDFGDIEDLDSIEEIDEFAGDRDIEEELYGAAEELESPIENKDTLNADYQRFSLMQASIDHYYKNSKYESRFIENVYIADGVGASSDLKTYLEEEMFLNVYIRHIDLGVELCELAKMELTL